MPPKTQKKSSDLTASAFEATLAEQTGLTKKQIKEVMEAIFSIVTRELGKGHVVTIPNLVKIKRESIPAKPARRGINPFTKEEMLFKAKPASTKPKLRVLKKFKDAVAGK